MRTISARFIAISLLGSLFSGQVLAGEMPILDRYLDPETGILSKAEKEQEKEAEKGAEKDQGIEQSTRQGRESGSTSRHRFLADAKLETKRETQMEAPPLPEPPVHSSAAGLTPEAVEVAKDLDILDLMDELRSVKSKIVSRRERLDDRHFMAVREDLTETILLAQLEANSAIAQIEDELSRNRELQHMMEDVRDRRVLYNNVFNFTSGGALAMLASGIQVGTPQSFQNAGNTLEIFAGGLTSAISFYQLRQAQGARRSAAAHANMLARIFDLNDPDASRYPKAVWTYLLDPESTNQKPTRRQLLIRRWIELKRIDNPTTRSGKFRVQLLSESIPQHKAVTIDLLQDRVAMLEDVRALISQMFLQLTELMREIRKS